MSPAAKTRPAPAARPSVPTVAQLASLAAFCKAHGLRRLKAGDVEMEFLASTDPADLAAMQKLTEQMAADEPDDEAMLMWSAQQLVKAEEDPDGAA